jgi:hypothetical protein
MKKMIQFAGITALAITLAQTIQAVPITGAIGFGGNVTWNTSSAATATQVTSFIGTQVLSDTGSFAAFITPIAPAVFTSSTWNLNDLVTINSFWTAGGYTFNLLSSSIVHQGGTPGSTGFVVVNGTGIVSGNGFTPTTVSWSFTAQDPKSGTNPDQWTFSASTNSVPDGGLSVAFLGFSLLGVALLKKKLMV